MDDVQRVPELFLTIKKSVDEEYRLGRVLLTASANVLTLPRVADSLAGRMETIRLLPLAQAEILGRKTSFLDNLVAGGPPRPDQKVIGDRLTAVVLSSGYHSTGVLDGLWVHLTALGVGLEPLVEYE